MNYETQLNNIIQTLTSALADAKSFDNGTDVAGKRLRQAAQDAKKLTSRITTFCTSRKKL
jgi:hypothetical protein